MSNNPMNPWVLKNFGRVDFKADEFDRTIYQKGVRITWEKSSFCSCIDPTTGQGDYNCPACGGGGYIYFEPNAIRAVVSGVTGDKDQLSAGLLDIGTSYMTTMTQDRVAFRDRLVFEDFRTAYSQIVVQDEQEGIKLKYECEELQSARILNSQIPEEMITLSEDKRTLKIDPSYGLRDGDRLSLLYQIKPAYIVIDIPHELRGTFIKFGHPDEEWKVLPKQFLIKREDLLPLQRGQLSAPPPSGQ